MERSDFLQYLAYLTDPTGLVHGDRERKNKSNYFYLDTMKIRNHDYVPSIN